MSFLNSILKVFVGNKAKKDISLIQPIVERVLSAEKQLESLTHDELRQKTLEFKNRIQEVRSPFQEKISEIKLEIEQEKDIDLKEGLYQKIDQLDIETYEAVEVLLEQILPEAFAQVKLRRLRKFQYLTDQFFGKVPL